MRQWLGFSWESTWCPEELAVSKQSTGLPTGTPVHLPGRYGVRHLLLSGGEGIVVVTAHHTAWGENSPESGHPLLLGISLSVGLLIYFSFCLPPLLPPPPSPLIHEQEKSQSYKRGKNQHSCKHDQPGAGRQHAQLGEGSALSHTQSSTKWSAWTKASRGW